MNKRKLTDGQVAEIRELAKTGMKRATIAVRYCVSPQLVSLVLKNGYETKAVDDRVIRSDDDCTNWTEIARLYNERVVGDRITPAQAKGIHDQALRKIRLLCQDHGLTRGDFE